MELTNQQKRQIEISVLVGASYLDQEQPRWAEEIDTGRLNIRIGCACPAIGWEIFGGTTAPAPNTSLKASELGFWTPESIALNDNAWDYLAKEWRKAIALRRGDTNG